MTLPTRTVGDVRRIDDNAARRRNILDRLDAAEVRLGELHDAEVDAAKKARAAADDHGKAVAAYDRHVLHVRELRRELVTATPEPPLTGDITQGAHQ